MNKDRLYFYRKNHLDRVKENFAHVKDLECLEALEQFEESLSSRFRR